MNLRRFVTYIYQYEQGKRGKNAGFIKVDMREGGCRMELQVRGQERVPGRGRVYLVVADTAETAIPAGEILFGPGGGRMKLAFNRNDLGDTGCSADQIQAVVIRCDGGKLFVSCWSEHVPEAVLHGQLHVQGEAEREGKECDAEADGDKESMTQNALRRETEPASAEEPYPMPEETLVRREEVSDMEGGLRAARTEYKKIEITDIRSLPKSNWHLCSNSFLIHGFFNYHYLMLKTSEENGQKMGWIGVPGVYEQPERMMALMFGFPEFEPAREGQERTDAVDEEGRNGVGVFGYWMCRLTS